MSRAIAALSLAAATSVLAVTADAAPATPSLDAVVTAAFPALPDRASAPASIATTEHVEGLAVEHRASGHDLRGITYVAANNHRCLRGPSDWGDPINSAPTARDATLSVHAGVMPFRQERLVEDERGGAKLEVSDVWVDPATLGARVAATARLPLTRLATGPAGFAVYGLRTGGALHVVIASEQLPIVRDADGVVRTITCGYVRVPLEIATEAAMIHIAAFPKLPPPPIPRVDNPFERRPLAISASLSRVARDPAPVLSVGIAWGADRDAALRSNLDMIDP